MAKFERLSNSPSRGETMTGWCYMLFEVLLLPSLLVMANGALGYPLSSAWVNFIYFCTNFVAVLVLLRNFLGRSVMGLGKNLLRIVKGAFLGFCVYYVSNMLMTELLGFLFPWFSNVNDSNIASLLQTAYWPMLIGTVFLVPFTEEMLFRGVVFTSLYKKNHALGYVLSTLVFCGIHVISYVGTYDILTLVLCFIQYIPASLCLAWSYTEADNIFAPMLIHAIVNAMGIYAVR